MKTEITNIHVIELFIGIILFAAILAANITAFHMVSGIKTTYAKLGSFKFYKYKDQVWNEDRSFIWFLDGNEFKLSESSYLHNGIFTWVCPYHAYWLIKYRRWMKSHYPEFYI